MLEMLCDRNNYIMDLLDSLKDGSWGGYRIVLYGAGYCGHEALKQFRDREIDVYAICDDARIGQELDGFPISDISLIEPDGDLKIFVTSGFNEKMIDKLKRLGLYQYYVKADFGRFEPEKETYKFFLRHKNEVEETYDLLEDDLSKKLFVSLINYRISRNSEFIDEMRESSTQYFPEEPNLRFPIVSSLKAHSFLDLGAYDGDSIRDFLYYTGCEYEKIIAVEASEKNYKELVENCARLHDVDCINVGISDSRKELSFNMSDAKNSFVSADGEAVLAVDSVDNILRGREVSFIKMDIEGAEYDAIRGAEKTIRKYVPILAVSVYHLTEDLFRLPLLIEEIVPGRYRYYMRHYSPTIIETILYAVPRE